MPRSRHAVRAHGSDRSPLPDSNRRPLPYHRRYAYYLEVCAGSGSRVTKPIRAIRVGWNSRSGLQGDFSEGRGMGARCAARNRLPAPITTARWCAHHLWKRTVPGRVAATGGTSVLRSAA